MYKAFVRSREVFPLNEISLNDGQVKKETGAPVNTCDAAGCVGAEYQDVSNFHAQKAGVNRVSQRRYTDKPAALVL